MNRKNRKLPRFNSVKDEARFWDTHDITDYIKSNEPLNMIYNPKVERKETVSLRMAPSLKKEIDKIASGYDISTSSLVRMWVVDKVNSFKAGK